MAEALVITNPAKHPPRLSPAISVIAKEEVDRLRLYAQALETSKQFASDEDVDIIRGLIEHLVVATFAHLELHTITVGSWRFDYYNPDVAVQRCTLRHLVVYCYQFSGQGASLCERLVRRLQPPAGCDKKAYVKDRQFPILKFLLEYGRAEGRVTPIDFTNGACQDFAHRVFHLYTTNVVGQKPPEPISEREIRSIGCGCEECRNLITSLLDGAKVVSIARAKAIRTHLERQLKSAPTAEWGLTWTTATSGTPHQLEVSKVMPSLCTVQCYTHGGYSSSPY